VGPFLVAALAACSVPATDCPANYAADATGNCLQSEAEATILVLYDGDLELHTAEEMAEFCSAYNAIGGNLAVAPDTDVVDLAPLNCLLAVGGHLDLNEVALLEVAELSGLVQVGGDFYIQGNDSLAEIRLPALRRVGGAMAIQYNFELLALQMPLLESVEGLLHVYKNGLLRVYLPALRSVGDPLWLDWVAGESVFFHDDVLYIRVNPELEEIDLPQLEWVAGTLKISSNDMMTSVQIPSIRQIGTGLYVSFSEDCREVSLPVEEIHGFLYLQNTRLTSFSLPELTHVGTNIAVNHNHLLETLEFPQLAHVGGPFDVRDNPELPTSAVADLIDAIGEANIGGQILNSGNGSGR
jgi:hypothetical protein